METPKPKPSRLKPATAFHVRIDPLIWAPIAQQRPECADFGPHPEKAGFDVVDHVGGILRDAVELQKPEPMLVGLPSCRRAASRAALANLLTAAPVWACSEQQSIGMRCHVAEPGSDDERNAERERATQTVRARREVRHVSCRKALIRLRTTGLLLA